jgi:hypothetical protein
MYFQLSFVRDATPYKGTAAYIGYYHYDDPVINHILGDVLTVIFIAMHLVAQQWRLQFREINPRLPVDVAEWPLMDLHGESVVEPLPVSPAMTFVSLARSVKQSAVEFGVAANYWLSNLYRTLSGASV